MKESSHCVPLFDFYYVLEGSFGRKNKGSRKHRDKEDDLVYDIVIFFCIQAYIYCLGVKC